MDQNYLHVFLESMRVASIIPFSSEPSYFAMKAFGGFDMKLATLLAITGATIGMVFNWLVGQLLLKLHQYKKFSVSDYWYGRVARFFNRYGALLLLLSWAPLFKFFLVMAGFLNMRMRFFLPLVVVGQAGIYGWYLLHS